jgi:hypothetical protein
MMALTSDVENPWYIKKVVKGKDDASEIRRLARLGADLTSSEEYAVDAANIGNIDNFDQLVYYLDFDTRSALFKRLYDPQSVGHITECTLQALIHLMFRHDFRLSPITPVCPIVHFNNHTGPNVRAFVAIYLWFFATNNTHNLCHLLPPKFADNSFRVKCGVNHDRKPTATELFVNTRHCTCVTPMALAVQARWPWGIRQALSQGWKITDAMVDLYDASPYLLYNNLAVTWTAADAAETRTLLKTRGRWVWAHHKLCTPHTRQTVRTLMLIEMRSRSPKSSVLRLPVEMWLMIASMVYLDPPPITPFDMDTM